MGKTTLGKLEYTENVKNLHTASMPNQRWEFCEGTYNLGWYYPEVPKYFALVAEITPIKPHKISTLSENFSQNVNGPVQINLEFQKHFLNPPDLSLQESCTTVVENIQLQVATTHNISQVLEWCRGRCQCQVPNLIGWGNHFAFNWQLTCLIFALPQIMTGLFEKLFMNIEPTV